MTGIGAALKAKGWYRIGTKGATWTHPNIRFHLYYLREARLIQRGWDKQKESEK